MRSANGHTIVWGANGGVGRAVIRHLCDDGSPVIAYVRDPETIASLAEKYTNLLVRSFEITEQFYKTEAKFLQDAGYKIIGMVDCVGSVAAHDKSDLAERFSDIFVPNVQHAYYATYCFEDVLLPDASVVLMSSIRAVTGTDNDNIEYSMAKAALENLTRSLMYKFQSKQIRVNCIRCTPIADTNMSSRWPKEIVEGLKRHSAYGELLAPDDVAELALFLLSAKSRALSGAILEATNGFGLLSQATKPS